MKVNNDCFCAQLSQDAGEKLFGTASTVDIWLLLEYSGRWAEEAFEDSALPAPVKAHVASWLAGRPRSRLLLIRQHERRSTGMAFYVALSRPRSPILYEFRLDTYDDLLHLDIPGLLEGSTAYDDRIADHSIFLVCTNGIHDKCCAKYGRPVYAAMARRADTVVWQSSHVGGDRFAANVVCLPHGIYYGRVHQQHDVGAIVEAHNNGTIYIDAYRGRSCYGFAVQAAEYFIREATGDTRIDGLQLLRAEQTQQGRWTVEFWSPDRQQKHILRVSREKMGIQNFLVCKAQEQSDLVRHRLDQHEVVELD